MMHTGAGGALPVLPGEILRDILAHVAARWAQRPVRLAKEEIREWTQYTLVCKEWQALFQSQPLCVVFDEVRPLLHNAVPAFSLDSAVLVWGPGPWFGVAG